MNRRQKWLRRSRRLLLIVLGLALLVMILGNAVLNLPPVKNKIAGALATADRQVEIGSISYWPWSGLRMKAVKIGDPGAPLMVTGIRARIRPLRLLAQYWRRQPLQIDELQCHEPRILLSLPEPQPGVRAVQAGGELAAIAPPASKPNPGIAPEEKPAPPNPKPKPPTSPTAPPHPTDGKAPRELRLGKIVVAGGEISIRDGGSSRELMRIASFELEYIPALAADGEARGDVRTGEVSFMGRKLSDSATAEVIVKRAGIEIPSILIPVPGGLIRGIAKVEGVKGRPFQAQFDAHDLSVPGLLPPGEGDQISAGKLGGRLRIKGYADAPGAARGRLMVVAEGLRVLPSQKLGAAGGLVAMTTQGEVAFDQARAVIDLIGGNLHLTEASLSSGQVWVKATGQLSRDGSMAAVARLYAGAGRHESFERIAREQATAPESAAPLFAALPGTDWHFHDFAVSGPFSAPLVDFWNRGEFIEPGELLRQFGDVADLPLAAAAPD